MRCRFRLPVIGGAIAPALVAQMMPMLLMMLIVLMVMLLAGPSSAADEGTGSGTADVPSVTGTGAAPGPGSGSVSMDPRALEVLKAAIAWGHALRSFRTDARYHQDVTIAGTGYSQDASWVVIAERPAQLAIRQTTGVTGRTVVTDGERLRLKLAAPRGTVVTEHPAPATVAEVMSHPDWGIGGGEESIVAELFLAEDALERLLDRVSTLTWVGMDSVDGVDCDRLHFDHAERDWDLWIERGGRPVPRRLVPDLGAWIAAMAKQDPRYRDMSASSVTEFRNWRVNDDFPAESFAWTAPEGAKSVESLEAWMASLQPSATSDPMVGKAAPAFELERLGGGKASLASHRGRDVVVLDFWATWCGPCRMSMPVLAAVAKDYAGKGVAVYAVNLREKPEKVKAFLEAQGLAIDVLLDATGSVGGEYRADRIPRTVIVGKDGLVKAVHSGYSPDLRAAFGRELDALLAERGAAK